MPIPTPEEIAFPIRTDRLRAGQTRLERWLQESAAVARARRLHALMRGDFGGAITAELDWRDRREGWVAIMARRWDRATTLARLDREERDGDARCRAVLEEESEISLTELLARLDLDRRSWIARHLTIGSTPT